MIYATLEEAMMAMESQDNMGLKAQQIDQYNFYEGQVMMYGLYSQGIGANGAHYGDENPFVDQGLACANCVFYRENACEIVEGAIQPGGICKFWIIPESKLGDQNGL